MLNIEKYLKYKKYSQKNNKNLFKSIQNKKAE